MTDLKKFGRWTVLGPGNRAGYWRCQCQCGKEKECYSHNLISKKSRSCGCLRVEVSLGKSGSKSPTWKGGRGLTDKGYATVRIEGVRRPEHRVLMEKILGRALRKGETVHHKNGVRTDNRVENLELWASFQPTGQRVIDLVKWAKEILQTYEPGALNG